MKDKPTDVEVKLFWGGCEFLWHGNIAEDRWYYKGDYYGASLPPIDLNNLFKFADPILDKLGEHYIILQKKWNDYSVKQATVAFVNIAKFPDEFNGEGESFEVALFWALHPIITGKEKE